MEEITTLGRNGYILKAGHPYPDQFLEELVKDLTVTPKDNGYSQPRRFALYTLDKKGNYILPRYYGVNKLGPADREEFVRIPFVFQHNFKLKIRKNQIEPVTNILKSFKEVGGGIISATTGLGKTILALFCVYKLKCKALIIVNRNELILQWKSEIINCFGHEIKIGVIKGDLRQIEGYDICIGMVNTLSMKRYPAKTFNCFDLLIVDECHTVGSEIFHLCLPKIRTPWTLGLSATPWRKDGLFNVVEYYLGPIVYKQENTINSNIPVIANMVTFTGKSDLTKELFTVTGKPNTSIMLNNMAANAERNLLIAQVIREIVLSDRRRKILVLSDRKIMLAELKKILDSMIIDAGLYHGDCSQEEIAESRKKTVILGIYAICGTGLNIPELNTLILASPRSEVNQMVGRILRKQHEINPVVIDIVDPYSLYRNQAISREKYYKRNQIIVNKERELLLKSEN